MGKNKKYITVFEHQSIKIHQEYNGVKFDEKSFQALRKYYGDEGVPYFSLINNGICFNQYVGVIQVGEIMIEILPKADNNYEEKSYWREMLIDMLHVVGLFTIQAPSNSLLSLKSNTILNLYFELFITEVENLLHHGLIKKYRKNSGNTKALKGNLLFSKHIQQNVVHQERFYTQHTIYDKNHLLHCILYKTINLLKKINTNNLLENRISSLLLDFPEMPSIKITEATFEKIQYNQKTKIYKKAIDIAYLLLMRYHPDLSKGKNDVLALMFDMNKLWEKFIYVSLQKYKKQGFTIKSQNQKLFWKSKNFSSKMITDIVIYNNHESIVLDTKWKNIGNSKPSSQDLRQMYVYGEYYGAKRTMLVYPGKSENDEMGSFTPIKPNQNADKECGMIFIDVPNQENKMNIKTWQKEITDKVLYLLEL
jgi:5-methylcytosine-specific restriction enzyme subunit McrC